MTTLNKGKAFSLRLMIMLSLTIAFWPVLRWYALRLNDGSDEPFGLLAFFSALLIIVLRSRKYVTTIGTQIPCCTIILLLIYCLSFHSLPPIIRAAIALFTIGYTGQVLFIGRKIEFSIIALLLLSLPVISSLQFYCGYPLRAVSASISAFIITLTGYNTIAEGTLLYWAGEIISVDAPCSGVKMLWSGLFANFLFAAVFRKTNLTTWFSYWFSSGVIFITNLIRVTVLFYTESKIIIMPNWFHETIGLILFFFALILILSFHLFNFKIWSFK